MSSVGARTSLGISVGTLALIAPVQAQETAAASPATREIGIEEVIVTARRVEESLQDVPISITVLSSEQIEKQDIKIASDLAAYTPSLSVNQRYGPEKASFALRGFNQDQNTAPTVGVYFADVVGVRAQGGTTSGNSVGAGTFTDLQNVQVLKGPQGTLFGRNTTGGNVMLVPKKPGSDFGGYIEGSLGDYDLRRVQGAINVPLSESFRTRISLDSNQRDGYMKNQSGIGPDAYNDVGYIYGRLSAVWDVTPDLENYSIFHYSDSETNGYASHFKTCDNTANPESVRGITAFAACDQIARAEARGDDLHDVDVNNPDPRTRLKVWQFINTTSWAATDNLTVKNTASYGEFTENSRFSLYSDNFVVSESTPALNLGLPYLLPLPVGSPFRYIELDDAPGNDTAGEWTATEELQLQGFAFDGKLSWVAGGYLEFSRPMGWSQQRTGIFAYCNDVTTLDCANPLYIGTISNSRTQYEFDNHGIFAQGTYKFSDQWAMTLGGRYTFDKINGFNESTRITPDGTTQTCNDTYRFRSESGGALVVTDPSECHFEVSTSSKKPTWLVDLDYTPIDDLLLYAKYARGYRQGGLNFTAIGLEDWDPEKVDAYELGLKTSLPGGMRGFFNVSAFYNDFQDQQVVSATVSKPGIGAQAGGNAVLNAGKSVIQGIEVDASVILATYLRLDLGYTFLDTELKELNVPTLPPESPYSAIIPVANLGEPLNLSPKHRTNVGLTLTLPLDPQLGDVDFGAIWVHTSSQIANGSVPEDIGVIPSTDLLNLNFNWKSIMMTGFDASLFVTNATDEDIPVSTGGGFTSGGIGDIMLAAPRMYGARLRYNFGA